MRGNTVFERFTDRARRVVVLAQEEARMLNHNYIGTEHILLGLIRDGEGVAAAALSSLGISLDVARQEVRGIIGEGQEQPSGHIPFTPRAKKVLELSLRESLQLGHTYIGTEHILLGLIREGDGVAAQVLVKLGADLNLTRRRVIELLGTPAAGQEPETGRWTVAARRGGRQLAEAFSRMESLERRLSAVEQRAGTGPETGELDQELEQVRQAKGTALGAEDYERAATLRDRERQLLAEKAARREEWTAAHPDLASLAERVQQLSEEVGRLRGLLRQHGIEPRESPEPPEPQEGAGAA